jgi:hypothetical protein
MNNELNHSSSSKLASETANLAAKSMEAEPTASEPVPDEQLAAEPMVAEPTFMLDAEPDAELLAVGLLLPVLDGEEPTQLIVDGAATLSEAPAFHTERLLTQLALNAGYKLPDQFLFTAGQVFYENQLVVEVRLCGHAVQGLPDEQGQLSTERWSTPTPPKLTREKSEAGKDMLVVDPADAGRTHLSAATLCAGFPLGQMLLTAWNLGGNIRPVERKPGHKAVLQRTKPLPEVLQFQNCPVHGATVRALAQTAEWKERRTSLLRN